MLRCRNSVFLLSLHSKARALTSSLCADSSLSHTLSLFIPLSFPLSSGIFLSLYFTIPLTLPYFSVTLFSSLSLDFSLFLAILWVLQKACEKTCSLVQSCLVLEELNSGQDMKKLFNWHIWSHWLHYQGKNFKFIFANLKTNRLRRQQ